MFVIIFDFSPTIEKGFADWLFHQGFANVYELGVFYMYMYY